jgi:hypothetical protein
MKILNDYFKLQEMKLPIKKLVIFRILKITGNH